MSTTSERTYGSRLKNALTIANAIADLPDYSTDVAELQPLNFAAFLAIVVEDNKKRTQAETAYSTAVAARQKLVHKGELSILKMLTPLKAGVKARYGSKSNEFTKITAAVKTMQTNKPVEYTKQDIEDPTQTITVKVSQSQLSYGSITESFTNLVQNLEDLPNYDSPRDELKLAYLQAQVAALNTLNSNVDTAFMQYKILQATRVTNYNIISDRANSIKAHLLSLYGKKSPIYTTVATLVV